MQALRKVNLNEIPKIIPKIPVSSVKNRREVFHDKVTCLLGYKFCIALGWPLSARISFYA